MRIFFEGFTLEMRNLSRRGYRHFSRRIYDAMWSDYGVLCVLATWFPLVLWSNLTPVLRLGEQLRREFEQFGPISNMRMVNDEDGKPRG